MYETLSHSIDDGILTITLNRPDQLNSFTVTMAEELERSFREVNDNDDVRAVIVTGAGRAFCAGMDLSSDGNVFGLDESRTPGLSDMDDLDNPEIEKVRDTGGEVTMAIHDCRKPVIAAINGAAVGIGATMTLAMDRRVASTRARVGLVFGRLGIVPEATSTWYLERLVGLPNAIDLVLRADILDAAGAAAINLVDEVVAEDELLARAVEIANAWTRGRSAVGVALAKQMVRRNGVLPHPADAHRVDSLAMFYTSIGDGKEGVAAFLEKRDPNFTSRASQMPEFYTEWIDEAR
ncbi:crotonase/enoyl-CoA hydratase family protein [Cumulibacter soli]|uniref:crotonase/enoyl-CoA hydratase family protein n=1 Tax=Cumulibacter soli TaxID=2546344 RepID=UPI0010681D43|nr:crotonase/enoyl-CoA hydratase family protein [Cumulibacter soli]